MTILVKSVEDKQEHTGAVDVNTPAVQYGYEDGSRANTVRRTSMTYPDGRILNYTYGTGGEANDRLSRVGALQIEGEGLDACTYTFVGAARYVKIAYPQPSVELSYFKPTTAPNGDAGDKYSGYDRFGRTVDMRWIKTPGASVRDRIQYGYDRANNRTWRKNLAATNKGKDNAYQYDGLYQVKQNAVGTLNTNQTAIGAIPGEQEDFSYDPTGNWTNYQRSENGTEVLDQSRVNNQDNQVTQIDGSSDAIAYDKAGNATKLPPGADGDWSKHFQLKWDGWNRVVEIRDENGVLVAAYAYDGMYRRTTKVVGTEIRSYYYNDQWKCVEERSTGSPSSSSSSSSANANSSSSSSNANSPSSSGSSLVVVTSGEAEIQYVWGARPNHRDELILRDRDTSGNGVLNERLYCLMDYYDPTSIVDTNGDVVERYRFSAFGVRTIFSPTWTERSASSFDFDFGFHGQFLDGETGYYDYGYRYYSPELGRWLNRDPIEEGGGVNLYGFVENDSIQFFDYFGAVPKELYYALGTGSIDAFEASWNGYFKDIQKLFQTPENQAGINVRRFEYGGFVCAKCNASNQYSLTSTGVTKGAHTEWNPSGATNKCPAGWFAVGIYHSHPDATSFSTVPGDISVALGRKIAISVGRAKRLKGHRVVVPFSAQANRKGKAPIRFQTPNEFMFEVSIPHLVYDPNTYSLREAQALIKKNGAPIQVGLSSGTETGLNAAKAPTSVSVDRAWIKSGRSQFGCCDASSMNGMSDPEKARLFFDSADY